MKREKAYVDARRKSILELLRENPTVRVDELAKRMGVSLITIRSQPLFTFAKAAGSPDAAK